MDAGRIGHAALQNRVLTVCRSRKGGSGRGISRAPGPELVSFENGRTALGRPVTEAVGQVLSEKGWPGP